MSGSWLQQTLIERLKCLIPDCVTSCKLLAMSVGAVEAIEPLTLCLQSPVSLKLPWGSQPHGALLRIIIHPRYRNYQLSFSKSCSGYPSLTDTSIAASVREPNLRYGHPETQTSPWRKDYANLRTGLTTGSTRKDRDRKACTGSSGVPWFHRAAEAGVGRYSSCD